MNLLIVYKKSEFEIYSESPDEATTRFIQSDEIKAKEMRKSHELQKRSLETVLEEMDKLGEPFDAIYRADLKQIDYDAAIIVGGDGTVLETAHYILNSKTPVLAVRSDPVYSKGFFCAIDAVDFKETMQNWDRLKRNRLSRLKIEGIPQPILNEVLYAHEIPAAGAGYRVDGSEFFSNGVIASTAAGSTGGIYEEGGFALPLESDRIEILHRGQRMTAPYTTDKVMIQSLTRRGRLYIDGQHLSYPLGLGEQVAIEKGTPITILGNLDAKRQGYR